MKPIVFYILLLTLTGCMQPKMGPQPILSKEKRVQYLQEMRQWQASGRIAITRGTENINASFTWKQDGKKYNIVFSSPFSSETVTVVGDDKQHKVLSCDDEDDEDMQLEQDLPFAQMAAWIKGAISPTSTPQIITYDRYNQIRTLQQDGWSLEFQTYTDCRPVSLPERMTITDGKTKAKLLIKNWQK
ncbi:MAG TPA: lipoprotein insertase outer membrane protein LolB [Gammaproteobacteria bacterium]|nr:lipoprotein insertase outer membrane protein LolB [Gammaproteobacteria bacterium]